MDSKISLRRLTKENSHAANCLMCHDGGGNLYQCYRGTCKKIYHIDCYDPSNPREPDDYWKCLLCKSRGEFEDLPNDVDKYGNMGERDFYLCFRLMLELKSNWPMSKTFEPSETLDSEQYRGLIHYPLAMDVIQQRLNRSKGDNKYTNCIQFMVEIRRMFSNCRTFWTVNTAYSYSAGMYMRHADQLEKFFDKKLQEYEKLFSYYVNPEDLPSPPPKQRNANEPRPEPYVPSFMLVDTPERPTQAKQKSTYTKRLYDELHPLKDHKADNFGKTPPKAKKCFVCHKEDKPDASTHKCSKCKRGYHSECYVPALKRDPPEDWNCIMCVNVEDLGDQPNEPNKEGGKLGKQDYLICSRLFLELHQIWPDVKTFLLMEALDFQMYRNVINHPVALDLIRKKLDRKSPLQYESVKEFLKDVRLMFRNCKIFWKDQPVGENFIKHADTLKEHLDKCLQEFQPLLQLKLSKDETREKKSYTYDRPSSKRDKNRDKYKREAGDQKPSEGNLRRIIKKHESDEEDSEDERDEITGRKKPGPKFSKQGKGVKAEADESEDEDDKSSKKKDRKAKKQLKKEQEVSESEDDMPLKKKGKNDNKKSKPKKKDSETESEEERSSKRKDKKKSNGKKKDDESDSEEEKPSKRKATRATKKSRAKKDESESESEEEEEKSSKRKATRATKKSRAKKDESESESEEEEEKSAKRKTTRATMKSKAKKDESESESEEEEKSGKRKATKVRRKPKAKKDESESDEEEKSAKEKDKKKSKSKIKKPDSESEEEMPIRRKSKRNAEKKIEETEAESEEDKSSKQKDKKRSKVKKDDENSDTEEESSSKGKDKKSEVKNETKKEPKKEKDGSDSEDENSEKRKSRKVKPEKKEPESEEEVPLKSSKRDRERSTSTSGRPRERSESTSGKNRPREESIKDKPVPASSRRLRSVSANEPKEKDLKELQKEAINVKAIEKAQEQVSGKATYECNYCNAVYGKLAKMEDHTLNHFEEKLASLLPVAKNCPTGFKCPTCDKIYAEHDLLMRHYAFDCTTVNETQECIRKNLEKKNPNEWEL